MEFNKRCGITVALVEMYFVYSSDQKIFPVMKVLLAKAGIGVCSPFSWLVSLGLLFSSPSSNLLPPCPKSPKGYAFSG